MTLFTLESYANTLYVSTTGDDKNTATLSSPLKTIEKALEIAKTKSEKKITIILRKETYPITHGIQISNTNKPFPSQSLTLNKP